MTYLDDPMAAQVRAAARARELPAGIGAAAVRDVSAVDIDGKQLLLVISDGEDYAQIEVVVARAQEVTDRVIELAVEAVEQRAGTFPRETRLEDMAEQRVFHVSTV